MQRIDLMQAIAERPFYKERPRRFGLKATLLVSNVLWIGVAVVLLTLIFTLTKAGAFLTGKFIEQTTRLAQLENAKAQAVAERDSKISRLLAFQASSTSDILSMVRTINKVYNTAGNSTQADFFEQALPEALRIQISEGIPASAVMAQAIYESSYGQSKLSRQYHNYFGLKAFNDWSGPRAESMPTVEYGTTPIVADFRAYPSVSEGFNGYVAFLRRSNRYDSAFNEKTGLGFIQSIIKAGYCPDPHYMGAIKQIIERHNLDKLDEIYAAQVAKGAVASAGHDQNS